MLRDTPTPHGKWMLFGVSTASIRWLTTTRGARDLWNSHRFRIDSSPSNSKQFRVKEPQHFNSPRCPDADRTETADPVPRLPRLPHPELATPTRPRVSFRSQISPEVPYAHAAVSDLCFLHRSIGRRDPLASRFRPKLLYDAHSERAVQRSRQH